MNHELRRGKTTRFRRRLVAVPAAALALLTVLPVPAEADHDPAKPIDGPTFREVGRVPVPKVSDGPNGSGWLIVNPASRRGYMLVESGADTTVESFDLDTLRPLRRATVYGIPVASGDGDGPGSTVDSAEVVHAVDAAVGRIYIAMSSLGLGLSAAGQPERRRIFDFVLVLDEARFDRDPAHAFGAFTLPLDQARLRAYSFMGMAVDRHRVAPGVPGKLLAAFASPGHTGYFSPSTTLRALYDHTLVRWDPSGVATDQPPPPGINQVFSSGDPNGYVPLPVRGDWQRVLAQCATASMTSEGDLALNAKNLAWGILPTPDAVYLGCQSSAGSGAVVQVGLDPLTGQLATERLFPLAKRVADVVVDEAGGLLLLESFGGGVGPPGTTWWAFDTRTQRYTGSIVASALDPSRAPSSVGLDPGTGRFYLLGPDHCLELRNPPPAPLARLPVRGGLRVAEPRLEPVAAPVNVVPELAWPMLYAIRVDPVHRRVFVRLGHPRGDAQDRYPECDPGKRESHPQYTESFYRVYEDRTPPVVAPPAFDDAFSTTDVAEKAGSTQASYLGAGSGYGARSLLIGGLDALTQGAPTLARSLCGRDDREVLLGSVGKVEVSDQSTVAEAAALDADADTQKALGDPLSRCRPQAPSTPAGERNSDELNRCHGGLDVREGAFDQARPGVDDNDDGCVDRDGRNRYAAECLGEAGAASPGFDDADHRAGAARKGFRASTDCDEGDERASAEAAAALTPAESGDPVRVAHASSKVTVSRGLGKGVTVKVDSVARGVEIAGVGTIGVVRTEATSTATGRVRAASATFRRTVCDVDVGGLVVSGCLGDERQQQSMVDNINKALGARGQARLRSPDPKLLAGTPHGYLAGVQRHPHDLFADQVITRDRSLAVPGLELMFFQGEGGANGTGRQVFQLAGAQASTSYGIACLNGRAKGGGCAEDGEEAVAFGALPSSEPGDPIVTTVTETLPGAASLTGAGGSRENVVTRLLRAVPRAVAEALRLLFNNPRELGLLAALWALLYAPCYLGDRRRAVRRITARRLTTT